MLKSFCLAAPLILQCLLALSEDRDSDMFFANLSSLAAFFCFPLFDFFSGLGRGPKSFVFEERSLRL